MLIVQVLILLASMPILLVFLAFGILIRAIIALLRELEGD